MSRLGLQPGWST